MHDISYGRDSDSFPQKAAVECYVLWLIAGDGSPNVENAPSTLPCTELRSLAFIFHNIFAVIFMILF